MSPSEMENLVLVVTLITGFTVLWKIRYFTPGELLVSAIVLVNMVAETTATYLAENMIYNAWVYSVSTAIVFFLTFLAYSQLAPAYRNFFYGLAGVLAVCFMVNFTMGQGLALNTYTIIPFGLITAVLSYLLLRQKLVAASLDRNDTIYWLAAANLVYYTIAIPILSAMPLLIKISETLATNMYIINKMAALIWLLILFSATVWKTKRTSFSL